MALNQLSPGVNVREIDLTNFIPNVGVSGGAFVGRFAWGPVMDYTQITDGNRLAHVFGKPDDNNFQDWYSVSNFLAYTNNCTVVRAVTSEQRNGSGVVTNTADLAKNAVAAGTAIPVNNDEHFQALTGSASLPLTQFLAKYPGKMGNSLKVVVLDEDAYNNTDIVDGQEVVPKAWKRLFDFGPGTSEYAKSLGAKNDEVHIIVIDEKGFFTGTPGSILEKFAFLSKSSDAKGLDGGPMFFGSIINKQSEYIRYSGADFGAEYFDDGHDLDSVTVLTGGSDYTVGDLVSFSAPSIAGGTAATGRVSAVSSGAITAVTLLTTGMGYSKNQVVTATVTTTANPSATGATFSVAVDQIELADWHSPLIDTTTGVVSTYRKLKKPYIKTFRDGFDGALLDSGDLITGWNMFLNSEEVDVSLLFLGAAGGGSSESVDGSTGARTSTAVVNHVITNIAEHRKDCLVFFSPSYDDVVNVPQEQAVENVSNTFRNLIMTNSSYAVMDSGWKLQYDVYGDKYRWIPLNADIAGICARVDSEFDPWWSPAGYSRGKVKGVVALAFNPNKAQRDVLYSANVNPVVSFKGEGVILYGDRTLQVKSSAFQSINVRRLFIILEKAIAKAAQYQLFEFNDQFTRAQFRNMIEPYLREVKGRRGLYDFKVVCDDSNNTPEIIDRGEFVASIFIKPARSINFITLNFVAVRTGVEFSEIAGV